MAHFLKDLLDCMARFTETDTFASVRPFLQSAVLMGDTFTFNKISVRWVTKDGEKNMTNEPQMVPGSLLK